VIRIPDFNTRDEEDPKRRSLGVGKPQAERRALLRAAVYDAKT